MEGCFVGEFVGDFAGAVGRIVVDDEEINGYREPDATVPRAVEGCPAHYKSAL